MKLLTSVLLGVALGHGVPAQAQNPETAGAAVTAAQEAGGSWLRLVDLGREYVVPQYQVVTGGGKPVVETVTPMKDRDGAWRVSGYYVRPK